MPVSDPPDHLGEVSQERADRKAPRMNSGRFALSGDALATMSSREGLRIILLLFGLFQLGADLL